MIILSQIIGLAAVALYLLSFQLKKRRHIVRVTCLSNAMYVLQYVMLGAFSGAIMDFLSTVSSFLADKKNIPSFRRWTGWIAVGCFLIITAAGVILAVIQQEPVEFIPVAGAIFQIGGLWFDDEQTIRKFGLLSAPFWLVYNFISRAYGPALGSVLAICSSLIAIVRYRKAERELLAEETEKDNVLEHNDVNK